MAENPFDAFTDAAPTIAATAPAGGDDNIFSQFDGEQPPQPAAPANQPPAPITPVQNMPGVSVIDDAEMRDFVDHFSAANQRAGTDKLNESRGRDFMDKLTNFLQYEAELVKGVPSGAVSGVGTGLHGAGAVKAGAESNIATFANQQIAVMDRIDAGDLEAAGQLHPSIAGYGQMSAPQREMARERLRRQFYGFTPTPVEQQGLYKAGSALKEHAKTILPAAPGYEEVWTRQVGEGLGSMAIGLPLALVGGGGTAGVLYGAMGAGEASERAIEYDRKEKAAGRPGLTQDDIIKSAIWGVAPGATDVLPVEILLGRLRVPPALAKLGAKTIGRIGGQAFLRMAQQAVVEGSQEGAQQFLQNLIESKYNPEQKLGEDILPNAAVGAGVGGVAQSGKEMAQLALRRFAGRRGGGSPAHPAGQPQAPGAAPQAAGAPAQTQSLTPEAQSAAQSAPAKPPAPTLQRDAAPQTRAAVREQFNQYLALDEQLAAIPDDAAAPPELTNQAIDAEEAMVASFRATGLPGDGLARGTRPINSMDDVRRAFDEATPEEINEFWQGKAVGPAASGVVVGAGAAAQGGSQAKGSSAPASVTESGPRQVAAVESGGAKIVGDPVAAASIERLMQQSAKRLGAAENAIRVTMKSAQLMEKDVANLRKMHEKAQALRAGFDDRSDFRKSVDNLLFFGDPQAVRNLRADRLEGKRDSTLRTGTQLQRDYELAVRQAEGIIQDLEILKGKRDAALGIAGPRDTTTDFLRLIATPTPRDQWAATLGVSEDELMPHVERAISSGLLRVDRNGVVRRNASAVAEVEPEVEAEGQKIEAAIESGAGPLLAPGIIEGENVTLTSKAIDKIQELQAIAEEAVAKILPRDVRIEVVDNIAIDRLAHEDNLLALRSSKSAKVSEGTEGDSDELPGDGKGAGQAGDDASRSGDAGEVAAAVGGGGASGADAREGRILRQESATLRADGSIRTGRISTAARTAAPGGGDAETLQPVGASEFFETPGLHGVVTAMPVADHAGLAQRGAPASEYRLANLTYRLYAEGVPLTQAQLRNFQPNFRGNGDFHTPLIWARVSQHMDGTWEVSMVQRIAGAEAPKGMASKLYAAIEQDLGIRMSPSGILSKEGLKMWQKRSPESVKWHQWSKSEGYFISPRRIKDNIARIGMDLADIAARPDTDPNKAEDHAIAMAERKELIALWHKLPLDARGATPNTMFSLRGFYSPAIRAAESISMKKGTGEQFWKQITKTPGVRKDELEWMGLEEFLAGKASITRDEVLAFMRAHQVELDERQLTRAGEREIPGTIGDPRDTIEWVREESGLQTDAEMVAWIDQYLADARSGELPFELEPDDIANLQRARTRIAAGDSGTPTKFEGHKVPGGENYRELLIRLPQFEADKLSPEARVGLEAERDAKLTELNARLSSERSKLKSGMDVFAQEEQRGIVNRIMDELDAVRSDYARKLSAEPIYRSKHFQDQEIVHLRVDDRTGPNGEKVLFINEVQSDLHQVAQRFGYGAEGAKRASATARSEGWTPEAKAESERLTKELRDDVSDTPENRAKLKRLDDLSDRAEKLNKAAAKYSSDFGDRGAPEAPLKGELWLELALKRALLYAAENGYDAVSWSRSDQIAKAVGADPADLALQYDSKIGKFLRDYTKKWGARVEEVEGLGEAGGFRARPNGNNWDIVAPNGEVRRANVPGPVSQILQEMNAAEPRNLNPILRVTPQMRASVMEGQPLSVRTDDSGGVRALGQTDPVGQIISIGARAVEAEARATGKTEKKIAVETARHEALEFFLAKGFIQPKEWATLVDVALEEGWIEAAGVREPYATQFSGTMDAAQLEDLILKESIMVKYGEYERGDYKPKGVVAKVFKRIKDFLDRLRNSLKSQGFQRWEDIFQKMDAGEMRQRYEAIFGAPAAEPQRRVTSKAVPAGGRIAAMTLPGLAQNAPLSPAPAGPTPGRAASAPGSLVDIQRNLRRKLGLTVASGRLDPAASRAAGQAGGKLMGQFDRQTEVIRLRTLQDIDTEAHEVAHALENRYTGLANLQQAHAQELDGVANLTGQSGLSEGFAEFFRLYLTNPSAADAHAPRFRAAFEDFLETEDAQTLQDIQEIQAQYQQWRDASSAGRITAAVKSGVPEGTWEKIRAEYDRGGLTRVGGMFWAYLEQVYKSRIDRTNPIRVLVERIARHAEASNQDIDLSTWRNPQMQARKISASDGIAYMDITRGVGWENAAGRGQVSLRDALSMAFGGTGYEHWTPQQRDDFGAYLIARRGRWLWQRYDMDPAQNRGRMASPPQAPQNGDWYFDTMARQRRVYLRGRWEGELTRAPDKHSRADHEQAVADLEAANPQFAVAAQMVYQFNRDLALKRHQAGLDSQEEFDYKNGTSDYVPWFRDMTDAIFAGTAASGRKVQGKFKLRGSYRDFINPVEGIIRQVYDTNREVAVNKPKRLLAELADQVKGAGRYAEIIPATRMVAQEVRVREALAQAAKQEGLPPEDAKDMISAVAAMIGDDAVATLFRSEQAGDGRDAILHYMDGGTLKMLQIHDDERGIARDVLGVFEMLRGTPAADSFYSMLTAAVRVPQKAITSSPGFLYRNIIRDTMQASALQVGYFPIVSNIRTVASNRARAQRGEEGWGELLARHGGIMGGIGRTDVRQIKQGRISELRSDTVTLRPWEKQFWKQTINPWHEDFWKWAEWSEANARQTLARISFDRAIADVRTRYPHMKPDQQVFVALESAVQRSRDYTDYARMGDAPSQVVANRLIMFLNPSLQGPDKIIRAALLAQTNEGRFAAVQAIRKKIAPLFSHEALLKDLRGQEKQFKDLTTSEVNGLKDALYVWVAISAIALTHLAIEVAFNDPEDLEDKSQLERATSVSFTINGVDYRIPRGFDIINVMSNAVKASYESWWREDPTAWARFRETLAVSLVPAHSSPILDLYTGWRLGKNNFFSSDIEPTYMKGRLPEDRYSAYTSNLSRRVAGTVNAVSPFEISPLMAEYTMTTIGADWARDILRAYDVLDPNKPALRWQEYPFLRAARGLRGTRGAGDFWDLMGQDGAFTRAGASYREEAVKDKSWSRDDIRKFFEQRLKDEDAKAYSVMLGHYNAEQRRLHPMERAREFARGISGTMRDVASNRIDVPVTSKKEKRVEVSREVRAQALEILSEIGRREYRNALIALKRPGYENREPQPVKPYLAELKTISPEIHKSLIDRITDADGSARVYDYDKVRELWPETRKRLLATDKRERIIETQGDVEFQDLIGKAQGARATGIR